MSGTAHHTHYIGNGGNFGPYELRATLSMPPNGFRPPYDPNYRHSYDEQLYSDSPYTNNEFSNILSQVNGLEDIIQQFENKVHAFDHHSSPTTSHQRHITNNNTDTRHYGPCGHPQSHHVPLNAYTPFPEPFSYKPYNKQICPYTRKKHSDTNNILNQVNRLENKVRQFQNQVRAVGQRESFVGNGYSPQNKNGRNFEIVGLRDSAESLIKMTCTLKNDVLCRSNCTPIDSDVIPQVYNKICNLESQLGDLFCDLDRLRRASKVDDPNNTCAVQRYSIPESPRRYDLSRHKPVENATHTHAPNHNLRQSLRKHIPQGVCLGKNSPRHDYECTAPICSRKRDSKNYHECRDVVDSSRRISKSDYDRPSRVCPKKKMSSVDDICPAGVCVKRRTTKFDHEGPDGVCPLDRVTRRDINTSSVDDVCPAGVCIKRRTTKFDHEGPDGVCPLNRVTRSDIKTSSVDDVCPAGVCTKRRTTKFDHECPDGVCPLNKVARNDYEYSGRVKPREKVSRADNVLSSGSIRKPPKDEHECTAAVCLRRKASKFDHECPAGVCSARRSTKHEYECPCSMCARKRRPSDYYDRRQHRSSDSITADNNDEAKSYNPKRLSQKSKGSNETEPPKKSSPRKREKFKSQDQVYSYNDFESPNKVRPSMRDHKRKRSSKPNEQRSKEIERENRNSPTSGIPEPENKVYFTQAVVKSPFYQYYDSDEDYDRRKCRLPKVLRAGRRNFSPIRRPRRHKRKPETWNGSGRKGKNKYKRSNVPPRKPEPPDTSDTTNLVLRYGDIQDSEKDEEYDSDEEYYGEEDDEKNEIGTPEMEMHKRRAAKYAAQRELRKGDAVPNQSRKKTKYNETGERIIYARRDKPDDYYFYREKTKSPKNKPVKIYLNGSPYDLHGRKSKPGEYRYVTKHKEIVKKPKEKPYIFLSDDDTSTADDESDDSDILDIILKKEDIKRPTYKLRLPKQKIYSTGRRPHKGRKKMKEYVVKQSRSQWLLDYGSSSSSDGDEEYWDTIKTHKKKKIKAILQDRTEEIGQDEERLPQHAETISTCNLCEDSSDESDTEQPEQSNKSSQIHAPRKVDIGTDPISGWGKRVKENDPIYPTIHESDELCIICTDVPADCT